MDFIKRMANKLRRLLNAEAQNQRVFGELRRKEAMWLNELYSGYDIGFGSYGRPVIMSWGEGTTLKIGKYCSVANGVTIFLGGEHKTNWITTYPFSALFPHLNTDFPGHPHSKGNVIIGNDVWLAHECTILSGVTVGDGAVVGACAVVAHDVPPYAIVAGNPAKIIKFRFTESEINELLAVKWWDWPLDRIMLSMDKLLSVDTQWVFQTLLSGKNGESSVL